MPSVTVRAAVALAAACAWSAACGRASAPPTAEVARRPTACSLITRDEMAALLGAPIGKIAAADDTAKTSCAYPPQDAGSWAQADVAIEWDYRGGPTFGTQMADAFGGSAVGRRVAHAVTLGDDAVYSSEGVLSIRDGAALITVTLPMRPDSEAKATAIGTKLIQRLGHATVATTSRAATAAMPNPPAALAAKPADQPSAKTGAPPSDLEEALKGLSALFGDD